MEKRGLAHQLQQALRENERLRQGLTAIQNDDTTCQCDHTTEYCCFFMGVTCFKCFAHHILNDNRPAGKQDS